MLKRLTLIVSFLLVATIGYRFGEQSSTLSAEPSLDFSTSEQVWDVVQRNYLRRDDFDPQALKYGLAKGLISSLGDSHSDYMDPEEAKAFMTSLNGDLQGIGAELRLKNDMVTVINPIPGSPAEKAGIRAGDIIIKLDGKSLSRVTDLIEIVLMIRGPKGTSVVLTVIHEDDPKPVDIEITRDEIHLKSVEWSEKVFNGKPIAYVKLSAFTEDIGKEFDKVITEIIRGAYQHLVLDLRYNGGGYLEGSVDILSHFIEADEPVVFIKDRNGEIPRNTIRKPTKYRGSIVVLVNDSSASASEIMAGALRDYDLAKIIGVKTFGKGSVQEVHPFSDKSMLRLTIAEWMTPLKKSIEAVGIEPDQFVELDFDAFKDGKDNQLDAALEFLGTKS